VKFICFKSLREDMRKLGVNFLTAGIVGVFINHIVGDNINIMKTAAYSISILGGLFLGLYRGIKK